VSTRARNEKKFGQWSPLPNGGRQYWHEVAGRFGWKARYVKEVDSRERTERVWQEIWNENGQLIEVHLKYPVDSGHQKP